MLKCAWLWCGGSVATSRLAAVEVDEAVSCHLHGCEKLRGIRDGYPRSCAQLVGETIQVTSKLLVRQEAKAGTTSIFHTDFRVASVMTAMEEACSTVPEPYAIQRLTSYFLQQRDGVWVRSLQTRPTVFENGFRIPSLGL